MQVSSPPPTLSRVDDRTDGKSLDRVRLEALRYAVNDEAAQYVAIMRLFTTGLSGLLSDQSAAEVTQRLADDGITLDEDTVEARLSYLVEHGNLARSPRETEARSLSDYLRNRARYQLSQRGELVHRHVEELLGHSEAAREVSSEMLGGILAGLQALARHDARTISASDPDTLAREIGTIFAQFDRLVHSTREFYAYLTQVLTRYDLDRGEFQAFKTALIDYLQRFVDEVQRHMPQIADRLVDVEPLVPDLCNRANSGQRLLDLEGRSARRAPGLDPADWPSLHAWFSGDSGRSSDADVVRHLATEAMRALLTNLRRIASSGSVEHGRYADLVRLAGWFDAAADDDANALWATAFGLYSCRHLGFAADDAERPEPSTSSWWTGRGAEVPLMLRRSGKRNVTGRTSVTADYSAAKAARVAERQRAEARRRSALDELDAHRGSLDHVRLSDSAREELLEVYAASLAQALDGHGAPLFARIPQTEAALLVEHTPGRHTALLGASGRMTFVGRTLSITSAEAGRTAVGRQEQAERAAGEAS